MLLQDRAKARQIASDLIAEIASESSPTAASRFVKLHGYYVLEFVIEPVRYSLVVRGPLDSTPSPDSTVRFNPLSEAASIVEDTLEKLQTLRAMREMDDKEFEFLVKRDAKADIHHMISVAPELFKDAIWQARIIGSTARAVKQVEYFGRTDLARGMISSAFEAIQARIRKRMPEVSKTKKTKINRASIGSALEKFFPRFKESKELPSQRQFAIAIGVTPKAWRTFLANHHLDSHEVTMKEWYELMLSEETNPRNPEDFPAST